MVCFFIFPLFTIRLRAETSEKQLEELARRARKLQGDRLAPEDFAQFLNLPVTDTLAHIHRLFDRVNTHTRAGRLEVPAFASIHFHQRICLQCADGRIDVRHFVVALSTICQPKSMKTLRLAFSVRTFAAQSGAVRSKENNPAVLVDRFMRVKREGRFKRTTWLPSWKSCWE